MDALKRYESRIIDYSLRKCLQSTTKLKLLLDFSLQFPYGVCLRELRLSIMY